MNWTVTTYVVYLLIVVPLTIWVASTLSRNGRVFLADVFEGNAEMARAVNTLLVVGFYLVNLGFVVIFLRNETVADLTGLFNALSVKVGVVLLTIGVLHFCNLWGFSSARRRHKLDKLGGTMRAVPYPPYAAPVPPQQ